jgi:L,D-peptidoglycan transpeptidase YkuD (ErfK/YbiS/YcfS/YnhG family)
MIVTGICLFGNNQQVYSCKFGYNGLICSNDKREGDGCTPIGRYLIRQSIYYRSDRIDNRIISTLKQRLFNLIPITINDGWCDDVNDINNYNRHINITTVNCQHEIMYRHDNQYDLIVIVGYNDDNNRIIGNGSAIFIHIQSDDQNQYTNGCIALKRNHLIDILSTISWSKDLCIDIDATGRVEFMLSK